MMNNLLMFIGCILAAVLIIVVGRYFSIARDGVLEIDESDPEKDNYMLFIEIPTGEIAKKKYIKLQVIKK